MYLLWQTVGLFLKFFLWVIYEEEIRVSAIVKLFIIIVIIIITTENLRKKLERPFFKLKVYFNFHLSITTTIYLYFPYLVVFDKLKVLKMHPHLKAELVESKKTYLYLTYE